MSSYQSIKESDATQVKADRWLIYGSPSSVDCDVFVPLDADLVRRLSHDCKNTHRLVDVCAALQHQLSESGQLAAATSAGRKISVNVGVVDWERGVLLWSLKGNADETNNVLLSQYTHHTTLQKHTLYILHALPVNLPHRTLHTLREVLAMMARTTQHRNLCKHALQVGGTLAAARFPLSPRKSIVGCSSSPGYQRVNPDGMIFCGLYNTSHLVGAGGAKGRASASASDTPIGRIGARNE
jgi:hypothetical protein